MEFFDFKHGKGAIDTNFDFSSILKPINDEKFMQGRLIDLDDDTINRVMSSSKVLIGDILVDNNIINVNYDFGSLNQDKGYTFYNDMCSKNLMFFAMKNEVNGKEIIEICAITTLVNRSGGYSCSLYYLPKGDFSNIALICRICDHRGTNSHINSNGYVIDPYELHIHKQSEKYIAYVKNKYKDNPSKMLSALQSPDARPINYTCNNVRQLADIAADVYNVKYETLSVLALSKHHIYQEMNNSMNELAF